MKKLNQIRIGVKRFHHGEPKIEKLTNVAANLNTQVIDNVRLKKQKLIHILLVV